MGWHLPPPLDTRQTVLPRIKGMDNISVPVTCIRENALPRELSAARAEAAYLDARIEQLEAEQLASDNGWLELIVQRKPPREQMEDAWGPNT